MALGLVVHLLSGAIARRACALVGRPAYLAALGGVSTVLHEGAHALCCLLFRHRVDEVVWFDPRAQGGALGYVRHRWDRRSLYQRVGNLFIGLAPLLAGAALIVLGARLLLGADADLARLRPLEWRFWAFVYLTLCAGGAMRLSASDLRGAGAGLAVLAALLFAANVCVDWALDLRAPAVFAAARRLYAPALAGLALVLPLNLAVWLALVVAERGVRALR